jgi:RNA polymerase sigma-70 factor (ECF subfamily)
MAQRMDSAQSSDWSVLAGARDAERESDESLAARAARDADAFAELYRRYVGPIRRYCGFQLRDWWAVDDVTSEIFVKALESLHKTSVANVRPWLFTIARHHLADQSRRRRDEVDLGETEEVPSNTPGPEEQAITRLDRDELREAIARLTADQAQVIELRLSGLDGPEIRQVLGRSRSWVDTTQYRALISLRRLMNRHQSPEVV